MTNSTRGTIVTAALALVAAAAPAAAPAVLHVHLSRSEPMADSTVTAAPTAIRLWFSAPVQVPVTTVRVTDTAGTALDIAAPSAGSGANAPIVFDIRGAVADGRYSVAWRTMSRDGHAVRGTFAFRVAAATHPSH